MRTARVQPELDERREAAERSEICTSPNQTRCAVKSAIGRQLDRSGINGRTLSQTGKATVASDG